MTEKIVEYRKCPTCGKMYFPSHGNQTYCSGKCSDKRIPKTQKICPVCDSSFFGKKQKIYCSSSCAKIAHYEKHMVKSAKINGKPLFKLQNPIATIQGITINFTVHTDVEHDELLWFVQGKHKMGNLNLDVLKNRNWSVSKALLINGYMIQNPKKFDAEFDNLLKKLN